MIARDHDLVDSLVAWALAERADSAELPPYIEAAVERVVQAAVPPTECALIYVADDGSEAIAGLFPLRGRA